MKLTADWLTTPGSRAVMGMLTTAGHQAFFVGGCVRNALLGAPVADLDISTDAHPKEVMALAQAAGLKVVPTGIDHGTVTVIADRCPFEITTFRRDVETDGRRAVVAFAETVEEDAQRRDFTMNALYAGPDGTVLDPVNGLPDLQARRIRFIGDAHDRIREDYLRILRFFRFWAWYGDEIDPDGLAACAELAEGIDGLARERIGQELLKLLAAHDPAPAVASMSITGVLMRCLPGADPALLAPLVHLEQENGVAPDPLRRLASVGGEDVADRLRLSTAQAKAMGAIQAGIETDLESMALGYRFGPDASRDALLLRAATGAPLGSLADAETGAQQKFPIKAADLMPAFRGPQLGAELKRLETLWVTSGFALTRDELLRRG